MQKRVRGVSACAHTYMREHILQEEKTFYAKESEGCTCISVLGVDITMHVRDVREDILQEENTFCMYISTWC